MAEKFKKIAKIEIIKAGSNPDVDTDFNTQLKDVTFDHVGEMYSQDNVASIITFNSMAAKGAFKAMATIYKAPFAEANKITNLIPDPVDGHDCTLAEIFDPTSDRYNDAQEFRSAVSTGYWKQIVEGARNLEGRYKSTGVHACFTSDALINTLNGYKHISEVTTSDSVLTHNNHYKPVLKTMVTKNAELYRLRSLNALESRVTGNHPILIRTQNNINNNFYYNDPIWKNVSEINCHNDFIGTPINIESKIPNLASSLPFNQTQFWSNIGILIAVQENTHGDIPLSHIKEYNIKDLKTFLRLFKNNKNQTVIPLEVIDLPINLLNEFFDSYINSSFSYKFENGVSSFTCNNSELALNLISIINKIYLTHVEVSFETNNTYRLSFNKTNNVFNQSFYEDGYLWSKVIDVTHLKLKEDTYNFTVMDDSSYVVNGVIAHNCGVIIASKPLKDVIPMMVRQDDGRRITQWTYPECEDIGLIKFDFLGLDTVDLIQTTVEYIIKNGKDAPNMVELMRQDMDDKATYELLASGNTLGVFQLGSSVVRDFIKLMKPDVFNDIAACTAIMRPGPMGMNSHVRYANRKNGIEKVEPIHKDFEKDGILTEILSETQGLIIYQESILQISNRIAGMTLQEGDELRKAMGKKKIKIMDAMKPKFINGGIEHGYSEEAMQTLWDNVAEFAKYGFNKSHSVAYAMLAYACAYLKTHYTVEYMAALLAQNVDDRDKVLVFLQELKRMGITVGAIDINGSDVKISPDYAKKSGYDIVFGISGAKSVSENMAEIIVEERERNGLYKNVEDLINRCVPLGVDKKSIYINLALAGAFDSFNVSRQKVVDNIMILMGSSKQKDTMGESLFDMFEEEVPTSVDLYGEDYPWMDKLRHEAEVLGLYLTGHPKEKLGEGLGQYKVTTLEELAKTTKWSVTGTIVGSITAIEVKNTNRGGKRMTVTIDDGTQYSEATIDQKIIQGIDKNNMRERIKTMYQNGENFVPSDVIGIATNPKIQEHEPIITHQLYIMNVTYRPGNEDFSANTKINSIKKLEVTPEGVLPIRMRFFDPKGNNDETSYNKLKRILNKRLPNETGDYPLLALRLHESMYNKLGDDSTYYLRLVEEMEQRDTSANKNDDNNENTNLFGEEITETNNKKKTVLYDLPPYNREDYITNEKMSEEELAYLSLPYIDTGYRLDKNNRIEEILSTICSGERIDYGIFNLNLPSSE